MWMTSRLTEMGYDEEVNASLFADDMAVVVSGDTIEEAEKRGQEILNLVMKWSIEWGLKLSTLKTCIMMTGPKSKRTRLPTLYFDPNVRLTPVTYNANPIFLGTVFDEDMNFHPHFNHVKARFERRLSVMKALAGTTWGCKASTLRAIYLTYVLPVASYSLGIYGPAMTDNKVQELQVLHNRAARIITGCLPSTPIQDLLHIANLLPIKQMISYEASNLYERFSRMKATTGHKATQLAGEADRSWLKDVQHRALFENRLDKYEKAPLHNVSPFPPWEWDLLSKLDIRAEGQGVKRLTKDQQRAYGERVLKQLQQADVTIFTDGSVNAEKACGGAGAVIMVGTRKIVLNKSSCKYSDSFHAELTAIEMALAHCDEKERLATMRVNVLTDSLSSLQKLQQGPARQREDIVVRIWGALHRLLKRGNEIVMRYIPSHCGIAMNEEADMLAARGARLPAAQPLSLGAAQNRLRSCAREAFEETWTKTAYNKLCNGRKAPKRNGMSRKDEETINQLKTGHHHLIKDFTMAGHRPPCQHCTVTRCTIEHLLLKCPSTAQKRAKFPTIVSLETALMVYPQETAKMIAEDDKK
eukprot:TRINITY_DN4123_c0_g1_i13.p1 TRINITY_DN4123_c0_g1~~TRINITY_DN4123_c0_g1_i13.p1  ORF type:complete len:584 (+),score=120.04 TRINITY_DN4123_c0_g1_i13:2006-3757(+)